MQFSKSQKLNDWSLMIGRIYGDTQNYSKSSYEIHSHMTEVSGAFGKLLFKKGDKDGALEFLPKMFVWAIALFRKMKTSQVDIEESLLIKYPRVCSYCTQAPCGCWKDEKPDINAEKMRDLHFRNSPEQDRSLNGFQMMFRNIYGESWGLDKPQNGINDDALNAMRSIYTRLVEELSETAEAIRFHHLYPSNFSNELADYFAWWFALVSNFNRLYNDERSILLAEDILWNAYPGFCLECGLVPCDCRPGPVRELLSKPALNKLESVDGLTQAENQKSFFQTIQEMAAKQYPVALPISCIRIDIDDFKEFNNEISHAAGDTALKTLVTVIRQKVRPRDRIFRVGGDEFAILCQDLSDAEAEGMMQRVANSLQDKKVKGKNVKGEDIEKIIKLSIGIVTCLDIEKIEEKFKLADDAAIESKQNGKNRITRR